MIYIIGHLKPDLDSAVSAVSLKYLFDQAASFERPNAQAVLASEANFETQTIFSKYGFAIPLVLNKENIKPDDTFVLVDHNETSQRLEGITNDQIIEIIDHHKISLSLSSPIYILIYPWGSTNSLIWWMMKRDDIKPDKNLASLMIAAILSDTVGFKSPTTTRVDKLFVDQLNQIAHIENLNDLTYEILKAKSNLSGLTPKQILTKDYKIYEFNKRKILINQVETADQESLLKNSDTLIKEMANLKKEMQLSWLVSVITDIFKINSKALVLSEDERWLIKAFPQAKKIKTGVYNLGPLMSRKKEIVPPIEKIFI